MRPSKRSEQRPNPRKRPPSLRVLCGIPVTRGGWQYGRGWLTEADGKAAQKRWYARAAQWIDAGDQLPQCGGCDFFAAMNGDWGACVCAESEHDGRIVFEHSGCPKHTAAETFR